MNLFDEFGCEYDQMIKWDTRLEKEAPFFQKLFATHGVGTILDLGCGTGQHDIMFSSWGKQVTGADPSPAMIDQARVNVAQAGKPNLHADFLVASFQDIANKVKGPFDAVTVLGNSLPHLLSQEELEKFLSEVYQLLNSQGILIIQNRNYDRVLQTRERFMGLNSHSIGEDERLFLRFMDFNEKLIQFNIVTMTKRQGKWDYEVHSNPLRPIRRAEMELALTKAGWQKLSFYGNYQNKPFEENNSGDLIIVAVKE